MKFHLLSIFLLSTALTYAEPASENLRDTFFFRSIGTVTSTTYFLEAKIFNAEKDEFEMRFLNAANFRSAIIVEHQFTEDSLAFPGWIEAVKFGLKERNRGFVFTKEETRDLVQQSFTSSSLVKCREKVSEAGIGKVLFYLSGYRHAAHAESNIWFEKNGIDPSARGPLPQVLFEHGYFPHESQSLLGYDTERQYKEALGDYFTMMIDLGVLDSQSLY